MTRTGLSIAAGMMSTLGLAGCAPEMSSAPAPEPLSTQLVRSEPALADGRFRRLLDFESPSDAVFVETQPPGAGADKGPAHSGQGSLTVPAGVRSIAVDLAKLLPADHPLSDQWTLCGAYLRAERDVQVRVEYVPGGSEQSQSVVLGGQPVTLEAGRWTSVFVDLAQQPLAARRPPGILRFAFTHPLPGRLWCDDVMLVNNTRLLAHNDDGWRVSQRGQSIHITAAGAALSFPTPDLSAEGWQLREANALRTRLEQFNAAAPVFRTIYHDGRQYVNGVYDPLTAQNQSAQQAQHESPAEITVPEGMGHAIRNSLGDANNDGYNEQRGSYQVLAKGARIDITLLPRTAVLVHPVLEISGLPAGDVLVTIEGQLVEESVRTAEGTLLLELPTPLQRPTTVNVRVK